MCVAKYRIESFNTVRQVQMALIEFVWNGCYDVWAIHGPTPLTSEFIFNVTLHGLLCLFAMYVPLKHIHTHTGTNMQSVQVDLLFK